MILYLILCLTKLLKDYWPFRVKSYKTIKNVWIYCLIRLENNWKLIKIRKISYKDEKKWKWEREREREKTRIRMSITCEAFRTRKYVVYYWTEGTERNDRYDTLPGKKIAFLFSWFNLTVAVVCTCHQQYSFSLSKKDFIFKLVPYKAI